MSIETLKQALAKLRSAQECHPRAVLALTMEAEELIEKAISEAENQEPVAKMTAHRAAFFMERFKREEKLLGPNEKTAVDFVLAMLDTHPEPKREPLTWQRLQEIWYATPSEDAWIDRVWEFARGVEAEHGIKGGA